jgi:uncharacterized protein (UPF0218 family)
MNVKGENKMEMMDFSAELARRIKEFEEPKQEPEKKHATKEKQKQTGPLYNIHKRSLPVGVDQPVVFSVSEEEANRTIKHSLKPVLKIDNQTDKRTVTYYDKVKQDGKEHDVYENDGEITKESTDTQEIILTDNQGHDVNWQG